MNIILMKKIASLYSMVPSLLETPLTPEAYKKELKINKEITIINMFSSTLVNNIIKK